jgi:hypothetical protein
VFENRVLRSIFGPKRNEVRGGWTKLHNEELHNLYFSPNIIRMIKSRRIRWTGHVARMGKKRNPYRILVGKPEEKRSLGRPAALEINRPIKLFNFVRKNLFGRNCMYVVCYNCFSFASVV